MTEEEYYNPQNLNGEIWKDIEGYEGCYQVSNLGRVKSLERINSYGERVHEKIKAFGDNGHGYLIVNLYKDNKVKMSYIHRLVANAFIPNPYNLPQINHKDEDKSNNDVQNLEWCTQKYNSNYGTLKVRARKTLLDNNRARSIDVYSSDGKFIKTYECAYDMEKDGISRRAAYAICSGRVLSWHGLTFRFHGEKYTPTKEMNKEHYPCPIYKYDMDNNLIKVYPTVGEAQRANGLKRNFLYSASYRHTRVVEVNGYKFSYFPLNKA